MITIILLFFIAITLLFRVENKCAYKVLDDGKPQKVEGEEAEPHMISGLTQCVEYNGKMGCCDENNDRSQITSYK